MLVIDQINHFSLQTQKYFQMFLYILLKFYIKLYFDNIVHRFFKKNTQIVYNSIQIFHSY